MEEKSSVTRNRSHSKNNFIVNHKNTMSIDGNIKVYTNTRQPSSPGHSMMEYGLHKLNYQTNLQSLKKKHKIKHHYYSARGMRRNDVIQSTLTAVRHQVT